MHMLDMLRTAKGLELHIFPHDLPNLSIVLLLKLINMSPIRSRRFHEGKKLFQD